MSSSGVYIALRIVERVEETPVQSVNQNDRFKRCVTLIPTKSLIVIQKIVIFFVLLLNTKLSKITGTYFWHLTIYYSTKQHNCKHKKKKLYIAHP